MTKEKSVSDNTGKKQVATQFQPGKSGNPRGRPKGSFNKATQAIRALLEGEAEQLGRVAIDKALEGDTAALRLCLDRIAPPRKDAPVSFDLPDIETPADAANAARAILKAVADGEVTPQEAVSVMTVVEQFRRTLEITEIEARIAALEVAK